MLLAQARPHPFLRAVAWRRLDHSGATATGRDAKRKSRRASRAPPNRAYSGETSLRDAAQISLDRTQAPGSWRTDPGIAPAPLPRVLPGPGDDRRNRETEPRRQTPAPER